MSSGWVAYAVAWCDVPCALRAWTFTGLHPVRAVEQATIDKELDPCSNYVATTRLTGSSDEHTPTSFLSAIDEDIRKPNRDEAQRDGQVRHMSKPQFDRADASALLDDRGYV